MTLIRRAWPPAGLSWAISFAAGCRAEVRLRPVMNASPYSTAARGLPGSCGGRWLAGVDNLAQRYQVVLVCVCCRGVQDADHGLPQVLQAGDLVVDDVQVGLQDGDDLAARRCLATAQADDRADFGQAEP
jgi:hypothetical protein